MNERILKYIETIGCSVAVFERSCGLSNGAVSKMGDNTRRSTIDKISKIYPELNVNWLLTGEGNMLNKEAFVSEYGKGADDQVLATGNIIRYWKDIDVTASPAESFNDIHETYTPLVLPEFRDCSDAVNVYGDSMTPLYKNGDIVIFKEWKEEFIEYGNVYLVITRSGHKMLKYVRPGRDEEHVSCESENPLYAPFQVQKNDIVKLYIVKGSISRNLL